MTIREVKIKIQKYWNTTKTDVINARIDEQLVDLSTNELIELQNSITRILQEREISEDVIKYTIEYLDSVTRDSVRYTDLTLCLERRGFRREAIARRVVNMWRKIHLWLVEIVLSENKSLTKILYIHMLITSDII